MPCNQHKTVTVNSVDEGINKVWQLAFTLRDLHYKRVLDSDLYEKMKIQKPEKKGPKASIADVIGILEGICIDEQIRLEQEETEEN